MYVMSVYRMEDMKVVSTIRLPVYQVPYQFGWVSNTRLYVAAGRDYGSRDKPEASGEIMAVDLDGEKARTLYGEVNDTWALVDHVPEARDGTLYTREFARGSSRRSMLYKIDTRNGARSLVADFGDTNMEFVLRRDGTPAYAFGTDENNTYVVYKNDGGVDKWKLLNKEETGGKFIPFAFTPDNQAIYAYTSKRGEPLAIVEQDVRTETRTIMASDAVGDLDIIEWGPPPSAPFAASTSVGRPVARYMDEKRPEAALHKSLSAYFPDGYVAFHSFSQDGNKLVFSVASDRDPGTFYLYDQKTRKIAQMFSANPNIDPAKMAPHRPIHFTASDGVELHGYLTLPLDGPGEKYPLILLPHGGPHGVADTWFFDEDAQFLASRGYAVLQVNYRGSDGRGFNFTKSGYRQWGTRIQEDLRDGVRWAIEQTIADPARICVYGASFGAYSALMLAEREPDMFKCAVGYAGLYDLPLHVKDPRVIRNTRTRNFLARAAGQDEAELKAISPSQNAAAIKVPVLLVHGEDDDITNVKQAKAMREALDREKKSYEWMLVEHEGHGFYMEKNRVAFYEKLEAFLKKHLTAR
jgi:dipeptidyl aminopeptidase/acylaminoacyl peptidase